jgi:hypothetical protein
MYCSNVTSHTKPSNTFSGHAAVLLKLQNSSEINLHSHIFLYLLGTDHAQKTQPLYYFMAKTTEKTSHISYSELIVPLAALGVARTT